MERVEKYADVVLEEFLVPIDPCYGFLDSTCGECKEGCSATHFLHGTMGLELENPDFMLLLELESSE